MLPDFNVHARIYKCVSFIFLILLCTLGSKASLVLVKDSNTSIFPTPTQLTLLVLDRKKIPFGCGSSGISEEGMNCFFSLYRHTTSNYCCTSNSPLVLHCLSKVPSPKSSRWVYIQVKQLLHLFF